MPCRFQCVRAMPWQHNLDMWIIPRLNWPYPPTATIIYVLLDMSFSLLDAYAVVPLDEEQRRGRAKLSIWFSGTPQSMEYQIDFYKYYNSDGRIRWIYIQDIIILNIEVYCRSFWNLRMFLRLAASSFCQSARQWRTDSLFICSYISLFPIYKQHPKVDLCVIGVRNHCSYVYIFRLFGKISGSKPQSTRYCRVFKGSLFIYVLVFLSNFQFCASLSFILFFG